MGQLTCATCQTSLAGRAAFRLRLGDGAVWKCARCSYVDRPLMLR